MTTEERTPLLIDLDSVNRDILLKRHADAVLYRDAQETVRQRWLSMLTAGYIQEKIVEAKAYGQSYTELIDEPEEKVLSFSVNTERVFNDSIKNHIESMLDLSVFRVIHRTTPYEKVKIELYWGRGVSWTPRLFLTHPFNSWCFVVSVILALVLGIFLLCIHYR